MTATARTDLRPVEALLVDMDGTLVNSDAAVERRWTAWALAHDVDPSAVIATCHGEATGATMRRFRPDLPEATIEADVQAHMRAETSDVEGVVAAVGADEFLAAVSRLGLPWAVVTNADRALALARLGAAGVEPPSLTTVEEVPAGKPDPTSYRLAADRLGVPIERCLVVEDSGSGVAAGLAAGAIVAALGRDDAHLRITDLRELADLLLAARD